MGELERARLALILRKVSEKLPLRKDSRAMTQEGGFGVITWKSHYSGYDVKLS